MLKKCLLKRHCSLIVQQFRISRPLGVILVFQDAASWLFSYCIFTNLDTIVVVVAFQYFAYLKGEEQNMRGLLVWFYGLVLVAFSGDLQA